MSLSAWLLSILAEQVGEGAVGRAGASLRGTPTERALHKALANAAFVVAEDLVAEDPQQAGTSAALEGLITQATPQRLAAGTALEDLEGAVRGSLEPLWSVKTDAGSSHATELGITVGIDDLTSRVVDAITMSIGLSADASSPLGTLVALLQTQQNSRQLREFSTSTVRARTADGAQATKVNAWVAVAEDVPVVYVMNGSDAPVYDVRPTPALIGYGNDGEESARVGHSPLQGARQIDPHGGFAWPMTHCPGWGGHGSVAGHVHVHFTDAAGTSWLLAHDLLRPEADPWNPR